MEKTLSDLRFFGNVALTSEGVRDMEFQLNTVSEESLNIGLKIRTGKA